MQQTAESARGIESNEMVRRPDSVSTRAIIVMDRAIYHFSARWLSVFNVVLSGYAVAVILAPTLAAMGQTRVAKPIYGFFGLFCHQDPDRSFHVFGQKFACCERCAAIYGSIALFGLIFAFVRSQIRGPRYVEIVALVSPVVLDGLAVGTGLYGGNPAMRLMTGTLFGLALIWFLYPRFETGFQAMRLRIETLFDRLVAQGRANPLVTSN